MSCRLSDGGEDAKVKGLDYLGAWNRLMADSLKYFRTELDFSVTGVAKTRVRLRVGVEGEGYGMFKDKGEHEGGGVRVMVKGKRTRLVNG